MHGQAIYPLVPSRAFAAGAMIRKSQTQMSAVTVGSTLLATHKNRDVALVNGTPSPADTSEVTVRFV
jgi:hypothetical protein